MCVEKEDSSVVNRTEEGASNTRPVRVPMGLVEQE